MSADFQYPSMDEMQAHLRRAHRERNVVIMALLRRVVAVFKPSATPTARQWRPSPMTPTRTA